MKTLALTDLKEFDGRLAVHQGNLYTPQTGKGAGNTYIYLVTCANKTMDPLVIEFYSHWLAKAVCRYKMENPSGLPLLHILSELMDRNGLGYLFWGYEITGCIVIDNLTGTERSECEGNLSLKKSGSGWDITVETSEGPSDAGRLSWTKGDTQEPEKPDTGTVNPAGKVYSGEDGQVQHPSPAGGFAFGPAIPAWFRDLRNHPLANKVGQVVLWIVIFLIAFFLFTQLLNPYIQS